ncbi:MAG: hypothetical protein AB1640_02410 [bacterium]
MHRKGDLVIRPTTRLGPGTVRTGGAGLGHALALTQLFFMLSGALPPEAQSGAASGSLSRSLERSRDAVVLESERLEGLFDGSPPGGVAVCAYRDGRFHVIPSQIDPLGSDGLVIPEHVNRVRRKAVYDFSPNPDRPERLGGRYQVLFMAADAGDRYPPEAALPADLLRGAEIELRDPEDGGTAWAYVAARAEPRAELAASGSGPPAESDYVDYALEPRGAGVSEQIRASRYVTGFPDADKPFAYGCWIVPQSAGGSGVDLLHGFRVRVEIRILFIHFDLDPKNAIIPYVLGYSDGPVRVTRRVYSSIVIKGIKMDSLMGEAKLETESHYYSNFFYFDGEVSLPGLVKKISKVNAFFTTDFTSEAVGLAWTNSQNAPEGCLVDGILSPQEQSLSREPYLWALLVGAQGGWANILRMRTESIRPNMKLFYLDDRLHADEKEPGLHGTWGSTGYTLDRLDQVEEKVAFRTYIFAIPRTFAPGDEKSLVRLVYEPLEVAVTRIWGRDSGK